LSIDEDEIRQYLENKKLKDITLPDNSNDIDQGSSTAKESKIGQKNLDKEKRLARAQYVIERDKRMQFGDKQAISEYMTEAAEIRQRLDEKKYQQRIEYDLLQQADKLRKRMAKITPEDIENEKLDIEKYEKQRDKDINNIRDYFNSSQEFWEEWQKNGHEAYESPAGALITQSDNGTWACDIHRYQNVLESPTNDGRLTASSFTIEPVENHFRKDPKPHLDALIEIANNKYEAKIYERKEKTLEDKDVTFKRELRQIDSIKTRPDGDAGLVGYAATKITKGQRARIRELEEKENEKNRKIYRGLY
jgi:hypothetical protein